NFITITFHPTAVGSIIPITDTFGVLLKKTSSHIVRMDIGHGQTIMVGPGSPIMIGDGRRFIMEDGIMIHTKDGFGFPDMIGRLAGSPGVEMMNIMVGRRLNPMQV